MGDRAQRARQLRTVQCPDLLVRNDEHFAGLRGDVLRRAPDDPALDERAIVPLRRTNCEGSHGQNSLRFLFPEGSVAVTTLPMASSATGAMMR